MRFALGVEQDVSRFDIAMDDAAFMRIMNCPGNLGDQFRGVTDRHRFAPCHFVELAPFDKFHAEVAGAVALPDFVNRNNAWMLEAGGSFGLEPETLKMRLRGPLAETDNFERNTAVETFLPRPEHYSLTASANFFQQLVIAKVRQRLCRMWSPLSMRRGIRVICFNIFNEAAVIRLRRGYGGRVAGGNGRAREQTKAGLEETAWTASLRSVGWDFGPALWANSEYARHYHGATRALLCTA